MLCTEVQVRRAFSSVQKKKWECVSSTFDQPVMKTKITTKCFENKIPFLIVRTG